MEIHVTPEEVGEAAVCLATAVVEHLEAHGEPPRLLFIGPAALMAIESGIFEDECSSMRIILVAHWAPTTTLTVA